MDRLEIAVELIQEAIVVKKYYENYHNDYQKLPDYGSPNFVEARDKFYKKYPVRPKKSIVNDNLKMARRFLLNEYMNN